MEENIKKIEKQLQEIIRKKTDENTALQKLLDKLTQEESRGKKNNKPE